MCHGGCRFVPKAKNCLDIYIRISTDFHISLQEAVDVLVFHKDENPVIHFGNITHHCNLSLSESQGNSKYTIQQIRTFLPIVVEGVSLV